MNSKKYFYQKLLKFSFILAISLSIILMIVRIYNSISLVEPLQLITTGADDEGLLGLWQTVNGLLNYSSHLLYPYDNIDNKHLHTIFIYNWFFYKLYAQLIIWIQSLFSLNDFWLPTLARIITLSFALISTLLNNLPTMKPCTKSILS